MMYKSRMVRTVQVPANDVNRGVAAECPTCGVINTALFGEDGRLVWWPNTEIGTWCRHNQGAYQGAGTLGVVMQFIDGRPWSAIR